ncbi:MAG: GLUG motif-containing protein [Acholeplasmataceae bacterium]
MYPEGAYIPNNYDELVELLLSPEIMNNEETIIILTGDIIFPDDPIAPFGDFKGVFDGNGHNMSNITLNVPASQHEVGLFSSNTGTITNVDVEEIKLVYASDTPQHNSVNMGSLVAHNSGTISGVSVTSTHELDGTVSSYSSTILVGTTTSVAVYAGGLVGVNYGTIINSYSRIDVTIDGIASVSGLSFTNSTVTINLYIGGLVGQNHGTIENSYATGDIYSVSVASGSVGLGTLTLTENIYAGGLVGQNTSGATVKNSFATGNLVNIDAATNRYLGRVVGSSNGNTNIYYHANQSITTVQGSYTAIADGSSSKTELEIKSRSFLEESLGFDFDDIWIYIDQDYPILRNT